MSRLTLSEQTRLAKLVMDRSYRSASARLNQSALLKWRYGAPVADKLLLVPQDLRSADPSFSSEIEFGHYGLAGTMVIVTRGSIFDYPAPNPAFERELHGFGWLRHLYAAGHADARDTALALVAAWCRRHRRPTRTMAWEPAVAGRRLMSWIVNAAIILNGVDRETYDATADCIADHLIYLTASWPDAEEGLPRLEALTAALMGTLCIAGHDRKLDQIAQAFSAELSQQILPDGGHVSRNPGVLIELLLDFLPLRQCFVTREQKLPEHFDSTIRRMLKMLRFMRLGDGRLGRFNGMSAHMIDVLSTVLAYDDNAADTLASAQHSKYARIEAGQLRLLMDVGPPPPLELACHAHAGCLAFELSAGPHAIFVNGGAPGHGNLEWQAQARATASHNTLALGGRSSAKLLRHHRLEQLLGGAPIRYPDGVESTIATRDGSVVIDAFHDGYFHRFKLLHRRRIEIAGDGRRVTGFDRLGPQRGQLRLAQDIPFAIHFHLDRRVLCHPAADDKSMLLSLDDGQRWLFTAQGANVTLEESVHYAEITGPQASQQIALRAATFGESDVHWSLELLEN